MSHGDTVQQAVEAIVRADAEAYARLFAEGAVLRSPLAPGPLVGRDAIREAEQDLFDAFSGVDIELVRLVISGRTAVAEVIVRATNTGPIDLGDGQQISATGRRLELPSVWLFDFDSSGLIAEERDYFDTAVFMSQLGLSF